MLNRSRSRQERGQEVVEFAILLPVLIWMLFGMLDFGRVYFSAITITNAARVGARYGIIYPDDTGGITAAAQAEAQGSGVDLTDATVSTIELSCPDSLTPTALPCDSGTPVRVTITYRFSLILTAFLAEPEIEIVRSAEMMVP